MNLWNLFDFEKQLEDERKINERFSRARQNIIDMLVTQEASSCALQSQMQIMEEINKKQKERMNIIQMEREELSEKLDEEIRNRTEILNKVKNNHELTDYLKNVVEDLNETLARCQSDNKTLSLAFKKLKKEKKQSKITSSKLNEELKDKLKGQEAFTKSILDQNNELIKTLTQVKAEYIVSTEKFNNLKGEHVTLTEKFNELEGQHFTLTEQFNSLKSARDDAIAATENLKLTIAQLDEDKKQLNNTVNDKEEEVMRREKKPMAMEDLKQQGVQPSSSPLDQFDKDDYCKPPPPKQRRGLNPKPSVKNQRKRARLQKNV